MVTVFMSTVSLSVALAPRAQAEPSASVSLDPIAPGPFGPFTATATINGCEPDQDVALQVVRANPTLFDDAIVLDQGYPSESTTVVADVEGSAVVSVSIDIGYPGTWRANVDCGGQTSTVARWEIAPPADFVMSVEPNTLLFGSPTELLVKGSGCAASEVEVMSALAPLASWASGSAVPSADGTWATTVIATVPDEQAPLLSDQGTIFFGAQCVFPDGARVDYPMVEVAVVADTPPPTPPPSPAAEAQPTFTG